MNPEIPRRQPAGFTRFEFLIIVAIVGLLSIIGVARVWAQAEATNRTACLNNLKQIGLGFRSYANRNRNRFPWQVPPKRGSLEYADTPETFRHFQVASNELNSPHILVCPGDPGRISAQSFDKPF